MIRAIIETAVEEWLQRMSVEAGQGQMEGVKIVVEHPANPQHGEYSVNIAMQLARKWRKPPLAIAGDIRERLASNPAISALFGRVEVVAPGFVNFHLDWGKWAAFADHEVPHILSGQPQEASGTTPKLLIEHTSINPNKSAHIGHLRNSCIGDTLARLMRAAGYRVEVHNYIDDLGNQLADTLVGLRHAPAERAYARFGDLCWDTYANINRAYQIEPELQRERVDTLHALESGLGASAWLGRLVAEHIVREHVEEMKKFGIDYDVLVWESSIMREGLWARTFELLKTTSVFRLETEGKLAGCWVLKLADLGGQASCEANGDANGDAIGEADGDVSSDGSHIASSDAAADAPGAGVETEMNGSLKETEADAEYEADKVLVRSNGVLTYTAKDIAYHLWKFGLLDQQLRYKKFAERLWSTHEGGVRSKRIGRADIVINVIDHRQHYPQAMVKQALLALGFPGQADRLRHVGYGVVSLSPKTAEQLGVDVSDGRASYPMSGRQGIGIKVADLLDRMERAIAGQRSRKAGLSSRAIATASIRYYLLRFHLQTEIVFDLEQATETTGNTGVYLLYSYARACSVLDRARQATAGLSLRGPLRFGALTAQEAAMLRQLAYWPDTIRTAAAGLAPSVLCAYAYELTTLFNHFYAACPILKAEGDVRHDRLWLTERFRNTLGEALRTLGLPTPERM